MTTPYRTPKRSLPMLESVQVASPCSAEWSDMVGDDRVRFCGSCEKNVYNLSAMLAEDAERLLVERAGKDLCVRFYQRADGTMMTSDCPVGVTRKRRKKIAMAVAGAGAMAFGALASARQTTMGAPLPPVAMGGMAEIGEVQVTTAPTAMGTVAPPTLPVLPEQPRVTTGVVAPPRELQGKISMGTPAVLQPPIRHTMGRMPARK